MSTTILTSPCWHCDHLIDLNNDDFVEFDTLETIFEGAPQAKAHRLCHEKFNRDELSSKFRFDQQWDDALTSEGYDLAD